MAFAELTLGFNALKAALQIAKEAKDLTDSTAMRSKIIEMQGLIIEAQSGAIDAREAHSTQVQRIHELEEEVARFKAWDGEKERYRLENICEGSVAYGLKPERRDGEPPHWLCANCYHKGEKSFLYIVGNVGRHNFWGCGRCNTKIQVTWGLSPK